LRGCGRRSGLTNVELHVNSIGDAGDRKTHREKLIAYFERHSSLLDEDARRRLHTNPLRILDSKNPAMQAMIEDAPMLIDELGEGAQRHFDELKRLSTLAGIAFRVNPRIVRGLDYYNRTVFEFLSPDVGAQSTLGRRRALRLALRAARRKAHARVRLRLGHRARADRHAVGGREGRVGPGRFRGACGRERPRARVARRRGAARIALQRGASARAAA
jgi:hypothetical protein